MRAAPGGDRRERAEDAPPPARLPRARPDVLLGHVADVHRQRSTSSSASGTSPTRRAGRATATRSSRPSTSSPRTRRSSSSPTRGAAGRTTRRSPRGRAGARSPPCSTTASSPSTTTSRRAGGRGSSTSRATVARIAEAELMARRPAALEAAPRVEARGVGLRAGLVAVAFLVVVARASASRSGRSHIGRRRDPPLGALVRPVPPRPPAARRGRPRRALAAARAACRCSRRSSAGCSRSPAPRTRACSGTRSATRTSSASPAEPASARRSRSSTRPPRRPGARWTVPLAAFAGAIVAVVVTYALGRSVGAAQMTGALVLAGVTMATFTAAVQTFVQQQHTQQLQNVYSWLLGGFSTATLARRRDLRAVHRGQLARARPPPARARRPEPRRRRGREPRRSTSRGRGW